MSRKSIAIWIAISAELVAVLIGLGVRHWRPGGGPGDPPPPPPPPTRASSRHECRRSSYCFGGKQRSRTESPASGISRSRFPGRYCLGETVVLRGHQDGFNTPSFKTPFDFVHPPTTFDRHFVEPIAAREAVRIQSTRGLLLFWVRVNTRSGNSK